MKVNQISATRRQLVMESEDCFTHEIGAANWKGRIALARHFLRVAWTILRRGKAVHSINGGQARDVVLEDILDADLIGE